MHITVHMIVDDDRSTILIAIDVFFYPHSVAHHQICPIRPIRFCTLACYLQQLVSTRDLVDSP